MKPLPAALTVAATALDRLRMSLAVKLLLVPPAVVRRIKQQPTLTPHPLRRACRTRILGPERRPPVDNPLGDPPTGFHSQQERGACLASLPFEHLRARFGPDATVGVGLEWSAETSHGAKSGSKLRNHANADTSPPTQVARHKALSMNWRPRRTTTVCSSPITSPVAFSCSAAWSDLRRHANDVNSTVSRAMQS